MVHPWCGKVVAFLVNRVRGVAWPAEERLHLCRDEFRLAAAVGGGVAGTGQGGPAGAGEHGAKPVQGGGKVPGAPGAAEEEHVAGQAGEALSAPAASRTVRGVVVHCGMRWRGETIPFGTGLRSVARMARPSALVSRYRGPRRDAVWSAVPFMMVTWAAASRPAASSPRSRAAMRSGGCRRTPAAA